MKWIIWWALACSGGSESAPPLAEPDEPAVAADDAPAPAPAEPAQPAPSAEPAVAEDRPPCVALEELPQDLAAQALNVAGMRCYDTGDLSAAAAIFRQAVEADSEHALAHYNLACTLAKLRVQGKTCEHDAYPDVILGHLEDAVAADERRRARLKEDPDLIPVHHTTRFLTLTGVDLTRPPEIEAHLPGFTLYGPGNGAFGHQLEIELHADHAATVKTWQINEEGVPGPWVGESATWEASAPQQITITSDGATRVLRVEQGRFEPVGEGITLYDQPPECSA